ncbi:MAG TPA: response regulator [Roseiflexaceae bacterium]|nr:response regulator [Roseiflexaceae bacterium]
MEQQTSRILVVDDEAPIRITLERLLQCQGYSVTVAASGEEALALLDQRTFDLLLLDLKLPGMSGLEVAGHARTLQPAPAILLLTGHAAPEDAPDATRLDAFEYILKTASPEDVFARVAASIKQRASTRATASPKP